MEKVRAKLWRIVGYAGFHNYDGVEDNNIDRLVLMPYSFKKEEVESIMIKHFNTRVVALSANFQRNVEIEI